MMFTIQHSTSGIDVRYSSSGTDVEHRTSGASLLYLKYMRLGQQFRFVLRYVHVPFKSVLNITRSKLEVD